MKRLIKKRLIKKSIKDYTKIYSEEELEQAYEDVVYWIEGGTDQISAHTPLFKNYMSKFPEFVYNGEAYRYMKFDKGLFNKYLNELNDNIVTNDFLISIVSKLVYRDNEFTSWTKDVSAHLSEVESSNIGQNRVLISIKSNISGFYITECFKYLYDVLEFEDEEDEFDYMCEEDEVVAPIPNKIELFTINKINIEELNNLSLEDFKSKINL